MTRYQYQPLDNEAEYIRFIYLLPAEPSTDVRVDIVHTRLMKEDVPKYEALSYVWGESDILRMSSTSDKRETSLWQSLEVYIRLCHTSATETNEEPCGLMPSAWISRI